LSSACAGSARPKVSSSVKISRFMKISVLRRIHFNTARPARLSSGKTTGAVWRWETLRLILVRP
jgi:hypothetical protein